MADIWLSSLKPKAYETIQDLNRTNYQLQGAAAPWKILLGFFFKVPINADLL